MEPRKCSPREAGEHGPHPTGASLSSVLLPSILIILTHSMCRGPQSACTEPYRQDFGKLGRVSIVIPLERQENGGPQRVKYGFLIIQEEKELDLLCLLAPSSRFFLLF